MSKPSASATIASLKAANIYTKSYPGIPEIELFPLSDLQDLVTLLQSDVDLIGEESILLDTFLQTAAATAGGGPEEGGGHGAFIPVAGNTSQKPPGAKGKNQPQQQVAPPDEFGTTDIQVGGDRYSTRRDSNTASSSFFANVLSYEDKQRLAQQRTEAQKDARERQKASTESLMDGVQALMELADANIQEIRMDTTHFKREVVNDKKVNADKIVKYFVERPAEKEAHLRKLEEKSRALTVQIVKQQKQIDQREGQGEVLHQIDFDQLSIENQQFQERIRTKNEELVFLKQTTMESVQVLNAQTEKLNKLTADQARHSKDIEKKKEELEAYNGEIQKVHKELEIAKQKHVNLKIQHESVKVPKVDDYIQQKAEMFELHKAAENWTRKVEIAQGQLSVLRQQINAMRKTVVTNGTKS